ncbi:MAG: hypothetical protein IPP88_21820 [Betaproteobacteria bacterium]|nr:hypothetical protein [Betaproteobacteria bacterium]
MALASTNGVANADMVIYRLDSAGQVDAFRHRRQYRGAQSRSMRLEFYADDRMLASGNADNVNFNKIGLVRLNADGGLDGSFGTAGRADILVPDTMQPPHTQARFAPVCRGRQDIRSLFVRWGSARDIALYRLTTSGGIDASWGTGGRVNVAATALEDNVRNMRVQPDGKLLLMSRTERASGSGTYLTVLARLNADGSPDTLFGTAGRGKNRDRLAPILPVRCN